MQAPSSQNRPVRHVRQERGIYKRETADGTRYEFCFPDENGKTRWLTVKTLKEARDGRASKITAVANHERVSPTKVTVRELAEVWFEGKTKLQDGTKAAYRDALDNVVLPRFGEWRVQALDVEAIAKLMGDLDREGLHAIDAAEPVRHLGRSSIDNYCKPLAGALKLAVRRRLIPSNPFDALIKDDRPSDLVEREVYWWSDDEVDALLAAAGTLAKRAESRYDYQPILRVVARLGLREGEALGLRWASFEKDPGGLHVVEQWRRATKYGPARYGATKTPAAVRSIALPPDLRELLISLKLKSRYSGDADPIFASRQGTPLVHRNVGRRGFKPARDLAGLPRHLTFHDLRDAAASRMIHRGLDVVTVAGVLGHEDPAVTLKIYAKGFNRVRTDEAVREALAG